MKQVKSMKKKKKMMISNAMPKFSFFIPLFLRENDEYNSKGEIREKRNQT